MSYKTTYYNLALSFICLVLTISPAYSYQSYTAIYSQKINKLAEILGSLQFISQICPNNNENWREYMRQLILIQQIPLDREEELIGHFNRSYNSLANSYSQCTIAAQKAQQYFLKQGEELIIDLLQKHKL